MTRGEYQKYAAPPSVGGQLRSVSIPATINIKNLQKAPFLMRAITTFSVTSHIFWGIVKIISKWLCYGIFAPPLFHENVVNY